MSSGPVDHVAIVGAGFSGTLQAINLLRYDGPRVTLIERRPSFARGVAYSTPNAAHLLNVRAANMSAFPDEPDHFLRWLEARGLGRSQTFARRRDYGEYLAGLLEAARQRAPDRLRLVHHAAAEVALHHDRAQVALDGGKRIVADVVILALGNLPPHDPAGIDGAALPPTLYIADPWAVDVTAGLGPADTVAVLGTGLTMVDVVLTLEAAGVDSRIVALSRRGLVPHAHRDAPPPAAADRPTARGSLMLRELRERSAALGWRAAVGQLRPHMQQLWLGASLAEQRRFIRHLRPWWDVHRHRLAPPVAECVDRLRASGQLEVVAGRLKGCSPDGNTLEVAWRRRGGDQVERLRATRVINCTGPQGDVQRSREPLLRLLLASGRVRADPHRLGIEVNAEAETVDVNGRANPRLLAVGPMTRGAFWEIVAVPEIRRQAWDVARRLCFRENAS